MVQTARVSVSVHVRVRVGGFELTIDFNDFMLNHPTLTGNAACVCACACVFVCVCACVWQLVESEAE